MGPRGHFMQRLAALLDGEAGASGGALVLVRLADMTALNRTRGRETTDAALRAIADLLRSAAGGEAVAGRLNGADFALAVAAPADAAATTGDHHDAASAHGAVSLTSSSSPSRSPAAIQLRTSSRYSNQSPKP